MSAPQAADMDREAASFKFGHINDAVKWSVAVCMDGDRVSPRGMQTREVLAARFTLKRPRSRRLSIKGRGWSFALAIGEFCWHISQSNRVDALVYYVPSWQKFSDDGVTVRGSCYGREIFGLRDSGKSQWNMVAELLRRDPDSRRAIITIGGIDRTGVYGLDVSCLQSIQFILRDNKLNMISHMRSNDVFIGLPYDVFLLTMLQEIMSIELECELGDYIHIANSFHIYERDVIRGEGTIGLGRNTESMHSISRLDDMWRLVELEQDLRERGRADVWPKSEPWIEMAHELVRFRARFDRQGC